MVDNDDTLHGRPTSRGLSNKKTYGRIEYSVVYSSISDKGEAVVVLPYKCGAVGQELEMAIIQNPRIKDPFNMHDINRKTGTENNWVDGLAVLAN